MHGLSCSWFFGLAQPSNSQTRTFVDSYAKQEASTYLNVVLAGKYISGQHYEYSSMDYILSWFIDPYLLHAHTLLYISSFNIKFTMYVKVLHACNSHRAISNGCFVFIVFSLAQWHLGLIYFHWMLRMVAWESLWKLEMDDRLRRFVSRNGMIRSHWRTGS